ncbi:hypothetical protein [Cereibacter azotoformans]|uniref:hypothetical protein n=1 Tax=Cereibacter azotoformans TaxID=43057 RepID=UPI000C6D7EB4|nr:hypothetical protein [Cereibacter azotoformans]
MATTKTTIGTAWTLILEGVQEGTATADLQLAAGGPAIVRIGDAAPEEDVMTGTPMSSTHSDLRATLAAGQSLFARALAGETTLRIETSRHISLAPAAE